MKSALFSNTMYSYSAVFEPAEEGGYTVSIPALPGCISEGDTFEEAKKNIEEAAELYIEVMEDQHQINIAKTQDYIIAPIHVKALAA